MNQEQKEIQTLIHRILIHMGYKSRPKTEIVEVATQFKLSPVGTKDTLLDNISSAIAETISQFRGYQLENVPVEVILQSQKIKNFSDKLKHLLMNIFKEIKKEMKKVSARNSHNMNTPATLPFNYNSSNSNNINNNPLLYNPTFHNYNFAYPYLQNKFPFPFYPFNNMNPNDNQAMLAQMFMMNSMAQMNQPGFSSNFASPIVGNHFLPPLLEQGSVPGFSEKPMISTLPNRNTNPYQSGSMHQKPPIVPASTSASTLPTSSRPMSNLPTFTSPLTTPTITPSATPSVNSTVTLTPGVKAPSTATTTNTTHLPSSQKMPFIIDSKPKSKSLENIPELKIPSCICLGRGKGNIQKCRQCSKQYHVECLKISFWNLQELSNFECPSCVIRRIDPLHMVKVICMEEILNFALRQHFQSTIKIDSHIELLKNDNYAIEVRAIRLDGKTSYDISWPDFASLSIAEKTVEFKPLQVNSSIKKRKDQVITVDKQTVLKKGFIEIKVDLKSVSKQIQKNYRVREEGAYILGVFIVKKLTANELVEQINRINLISMEESRHKIIIHFRDEQISMHKLCIKLTDPISLGELKSPARGIFCKHPQCFGLETFVLMMSKMQHRAWRCPVCNYRCYDLYKDPYIDSIIGKMRPNAVEIEFNEQGEYKIIEEKEHNDQERPQIPQFNVIDIEEDLLPYISQRSPQQPQLKQQKEVAAHETADKEKQKQSTGEKTLP